MYELKLRCSTDINLLERPRLLAEICASAFRQSAGACHLQLAFAAENKQMGRRDGRTVDCFR